MAEDLVIEEAEVPEFAGESRFSVIEATVDDDAESKVTPEDATYTDITWKSETPAVATIDKYGIIKGEAVRSNRNYSKS